MYRTLVCASVAVLVAAFAGVSICQAQRPSTAGEEAAIRKAGAAYLEAVNRGDLNAIKALWTTDGNLIDESGQSTNAQQMQRPASAGSEPARVPVELNTRTDSIRFVTPDVAIEDGTSELASAPQGTATKGRYSVVWVKRDGKWLIDAVREAAIADPAPSQNRLQQLDWLIGSWAEENAETAFEVSFAWSSDEDFILGQVRVQPRGQQPHMVTQRIGWDAAMGKLRSWNFDSDGGFSEAVWTRDGDLWNISTTGVLPDGKRTQGRRTLQRLDDESLLMESVGFQVDGEIVPDLRVKLVRKSTAEKVR